VGARYAAALVRARRGDTAGVAAALREARAAGVALDSVLIANRSEWDSLGIDVETLLQSAISSPPP
jgi:hypothetical protein